MKAAVLLPVKHKVIKRECEDKKNQMTKDCNLVHSVRDERTFDIKGKGKRQIKIKVKSLKCHWVSLKYCDNLSDEKTQKWVREAKKKVKVFLEKKG